MLASGNRIVFWLRAMSSQPDRDRVLPSDLVWPPCLDDRFFLSPPARLCNKARRMVSFVRRI